MIRGSSDSDTVVTNGRIAIGIEGERDFIFPFRDIDGRWGIDAWGAPWERDADFFFKSLRSFSGHLEVDGAISNDWNRRDREVELEWCFLRNNDGDALVSVAEEGSEIVTSDNIHALVEIPGEAGFWVFSGDNIKVSSERGVRRGFK